MARFANGENGEKSKSVRACPRGAVLGGGGRGPELGVLPAWRSQPAKAQLWSKAPLPWLCSGQSAGNTGSWRQTEPAGPDRRRK